MLPIWRFDPSVSANPSLRDAKKYAHAVKANTYVTRAVVSTAVTTSNLPLTSHQIVVLKPDGTGRLPVAVKPVRRVRHTALRTYSAICPESPHHIVGLFHLRLVAEPSSIPFPPPGTQSTDPNNSDSDFNTRLSSCLLSP